MTYGFYHESKRRSSTFTGTFNGGGELNNPERLRPAASA
jgi:hypothetical protein